MEKIRIGYLVNQYPMPSLTFIRREITTLEKMGYQVERFALRRWVGEFVDHRDRDELTKTRFATDRGVVGLLLALLMTLVLQPVAFFKAARHTLMLIRTSDRSALMHLIYLAEACVLKRWLQASRVQHLHVHFASNATEVAMLSKLLGGPAYSFMVHGPEEFDRAKYLSLGLKAKHAKFVATISSYARSQLFRWIDYSLWRKIRIVRCGLDQEFLEQEAIEVPPVQTLVNVGRLCEQKGQVLLVEAAARVKRRYPDFKLHLIGDGELRESIESRVSELGLTGNVKLIGWASGEEVKKQLLSSRGLVLPSFAEGLPVVIMEAFALRRPVISTWIAGIPELVRPQENGWLVPAGDIDQLANAMCEMLSENSERIEEMGTDGRRSVLERHSIGKEMTFLDQLIRDGLHTEEEWQPAKEAIQL